MIASKPFGESLPAGGDVRAGAGGRGIAVDRRPGLGATEIAFGALRTGAIDVYPEYTGTGLIAILHEEPTPMRARCSARVSREFAARWGVHWLPPLGFENTTPSPCARRRRSATGCARWATWRARPPSSRPGFTPDFIGRPDGLPGLQRAYGLRPARCGRCCRR